MNKRMLINAIDVEECRVALVENGVLEEFSIETPLREQIKGNIYKGLIVKIEPSLQAAFVDFGGNRAGFLPFSEVHPDYYSPAAEGNGRPRIQDALKKKQEIIVQVVKGEIGKKGAALTTYISLPGRYLVLMPGSDVSGVSRKIEDEEQRRRLKELVAQLDPPEKMGFIVRTAGMDKAKNELARDYHYLMRLWESIEETGRQSTAPALIYQESDVVVRSVRDYFTPDIQEVILDSRESYKRARDFMRAVMPRYQKRLKLYREKKPIFSHYGIEDQIESIYQRQIPLRSGGSLIIEPTEALVSVDVNSGRSTQSKGIEETAYKTNLEAASEISRQLRLRDLGGLVVIDFIDMKDRKHEQEVERVLRNALRKDKARVQVGRISRFGMLELSRQRIKPALQEGSYRVCPFCTGNGLVKTVESHALSVLRRVQAEAVGGTVQQVHALLPQDVANYLLNQKRSDLQSLEEAGGLTVVVLGKEGLLPHQVELEFLRREVPLEEVAAREGASSQPTLAEPAPQPARESSEVREPGARRRSRRGRRRRREQAPAAVPETPLVSTGAEPELLLPLGAGPVPTLPEISPPVPKESPPSVTPEMPTSPPGEILEISEIGATSDLPETPADRPGDNAVPIPTFQQHHRRGLLFWVGKHRTYRRSEQEDKVDISHEEETLTSEESSGYLHAAGGYPNREELDPISSEELERQAENSREQKGEDRVP